VTRGQLLSRINVLVVEDHADSREFLDEVLTYHGAAVIPVGSATRAMEIVTRFTPSIVIADIAMPQHADSRQALPRGQAVSGDSSADHRQRAKIGQA